MSQDPIEYNSMTHHTNLDTYERLLLKNGQPVPLTFKVFDVLLVLVENSGRILEKEELMQRVWPDAMVEEANLKNSISAIRKALGEAPAAAVRRPVVRRPLDHRPGRREHARPAEAGPGRAGRSGGHAEQLT